MEHLQMKRSNIRNICILAHVDHGKTTLADSLVASNGIISQRQAGKLRYLDSREDEQVRGITMKSSSIALHYQQEEEKYLVNLVDSPGHVDFSSEVSTAVRLCDGAVLVVDAVEGVCSQTQVVLQQAWTEGIKLCLVINKIDRLITELQLTPTEAYYHLQQVLEQVNAVSGSLFTSKIMEAASKKQDSSSTQTTPPDEEGGVIYDWSVGLEDTDDSMLYFSPEQGNVVFASALDGWGFRVKDFAAMYASKLGVRTSILTRTMWGDYFLNSKAKRIFKKAQAKGKKPIFVQFILENIWAVYKSILIDKNKQQTEKIVSSLGLKVSARDSRHSNPRVHLVAVCCQWLPLAITTLACVVEQLPSPLSLSEERVERLLCGTTQTFQSLPAKSQLLKKKFLSCSDEEGEPVVVFVSKLFVVDKTALPQHQPRPLTEAELAERRTIARQKHQEKMAALGETPAIPEEVPKEIKEEPEEPQPSNIFLAFSRVFSGSLRVGQELYVLYPRYDPRDGILEEEKEGSALPPNTSRFTVKGLYLLMGRSVVAVDTVPAGNIVGIAGLEDVVIKSATLSSTLACPPFCAMSAVAAPIVRVAIEPVHVVDLPALMSGMKLLNLADPSVEVSVQETGEHVLAATGEVHLQKCLEDLKKEYARVQLNVSEPIVPFRETVVEPPRLDMVNEEISADNERKIATTQLRGDIAAPGSSSVEKEGDDRTERDVRVFTASKSCSLLLQVYPLPGGCVELLEKNSRLLKALSLLQSGSSKRSVVVNAETKSELMDLRTEMMQELRPLEAELQLGGLADLVWCVGPRHAGPNILVNGLQEYKRPSLWAPLDPSLWKEGQVLYEFDNSVGSGFQLATLSGPLCEEPMHGVCMVMKDWSYTCDQPAVPEDSQTSTSSQTHSTYGPFSGQLISAMKEGCRRAFLQQPARLMVAMYTSHILATADVLGKVYSVLGRRNGRVLSEDMIEGSSVFDIQALLPVAESFGFAEEMRKKTSGLANPQLIFSHWEVIPSDPFWVPSTEEELLHFGEKADTDNVARKYMNAVRKKKGLRVKEKLVEHGEKQRTLKKNK